MAFDSVKPGGPSGPYRVWQGVLCEKKTEVGGEFGHAASSATHLEMSRRTIAFGEFRASMPIARRLQESHGHWDSSTSNASEKNASDPKFPDFSASAMSCPPDVQKVHGTPGAISFPIFNLSTPSAFVTGTRGFAPGHHEPSRHRRRGRRLRRPPGPLRQSRRPARRPNLLARL